MRKAVGQAAEELLDELDEPEELLELDEEPELDDFDSEPDPEEPEPEPEEPDDVDEDDAAVFAGVGAVLLDEEPRLSFR